MFFFLLENYVIDIFEKLRTCSVDVTSDILRD